MCQAAWPARLATSGLLSTSLTLAILSILIIAILRSRVVYSILIGRILLAVEDDPLVDTALGVIGNTLNGRINSVYETNLVCDNALQHHKSAKQSLG